MAKVWGKNHLTILIQRGWLHLAGATGARLGKFIRNISWAKASLRPRGVAFSRCEGTSNGKFVGAKVCHTFWNWGLESVGSSRECSLTRRTGRNSISIGWASEVSFRDCGAPSDTRGGCGTLCNPFFPVISSLSSISPDIAGVASMERLEWHR